MRLSEAIRLGAMLTPVQAFYWLYDTGTGGTCALGAAAEAIGILDKTTSRHLGQAPREWKRVCKLRPACPCCEQFHGDIQDTIRDLNNEHKWTRERIADWIATLEEPADALLPFDVAHAAEVTR